ncbi:hypothetical protein [Natrononativus amylolyticus]|uniref:hypothetical protein n=1 Tax=Natrononativus amylolyticus TaxID=2963434 RepID=UPI0020CDF2AF|nr:hypothetical protein [Natrononativus amylolyticus]
MDIPTDRVLIMIVAATGFAVLVGGWAGGLARAEASGFEEIAIRVGLGAVFLIAMIGAWYLFAGVDEESEA